MRFISVLVLACVLSSPFVINADVWANALYYSGYLVRATPFDAKLNSVGFFNELSMLSPRAKSMQSAESLFLVAKSFRYVPHTPTDKWQTPQETASKGSGNCADKALWLYTQLRQSGYDHVRLVIGKYRSMDPVFHVWVTYMDISGNIYVLDPAIQRQPWKIENFPAELYKPIYSFGAGNRYRHN